LFEKILVCLDGSDLAEEILPYAREVARRFGSKLVLLEVTMPPNAIVEPTTGYYSAPTPAEIQRKEEEAITYLESIAQAIQAAGLEVEYLTLPGSAGRSIVSYAEESGIGLIALGTHGRSGLKRLAFGSVAEHVLKESGLPVLAIKPRRS
jgi:nucleotide-binding universal stress UspA family protein